ncbi:hypothetical protein N9972_00715 [bacterium]|nr:hypothetical protein [bacterium]
MSNTIILNSTNCFLQWAAESASVKEVNVVIFSIDHWQDNITVWDEDRLDQSPIRIFQKFAQEHADCKFLLFSTIINFESQFDHLHNVRAVYWGPDFIRDVRNTHLLYRPEPTKNFRLNFHWVVLCRSMREHRIMAVLYLLGNDLEKTGMIRANVPKSLHANSGIDDYLKMSNSRHLSSELIRSSRRDIYQKGLAKITQNIPYNFGGFKSNHEDDDFYWHRTDNGKNFNCLRSVYQNSLIEIIVETIFFHNNGLVSEKLANCIYSFNFFISLASPGYIEHLRQLGFDVFDDVIDHSYDQFLNPYNRLEAAIESNRKILQDRQFALDQWTNCRSRMQFNCDLLIKIIKTSHIYNSIDLRSWAEETITIENFDTILPP